MEDVKRFSRLGDCIVALKLKLVECKIDEYAVDNKIYAITGSDIGFYDYVITCVKTDGPKSVGMFIIRAE